jgi:hypothetical protein
MLIYWHNYALFVHRKSDESHQLRAEAVLSVAVSSTLVQPVLLPAPLGLMCPSCKHHSYTSVFKKEQIENIKTDVLSKILGFYGSDYEEWRILGYYATWVGC